MALRGAISRSLPDFFKVHVRVYRALKQHERSRPSWQMIKQELLENAKLVSDIFVLLDRLPKGGIVAEIGVAAGDRSRQILERCRPKKIFLVDPWTDNSKGGSSDISYHRIQDRMRYEIAAGVVELRRGHPHDVLQSFPDNTFDLAYIDAAHDYDTVCKDIENCYRIVKPGGIIAGNDYVRWVSPFARYGVVEAVNEFVNRTESPFVFLTNQLDKHDSFAVRVNK